MGAMVLLYAAAVVARFGTTKGSPTRCTNGALDVDETACALALGSMLS